MPNNLVIYRPLNLETYKETDYEKRALASLSAVELVTALLEASPTLAVVGLQVKIVNGTVQLATSRWRTANKPPSLPSVVNGLVNLVHQSWRCWLAWPSSNR